MQCNRVYLKKKKVFLAVFVSWICWLVDVAIFFFILGNEPNNDEITTANQDNEFMRKTGLPNLKNDFTY